MTSIYPKWTGTTSAQLHESRFPHWVGIGVLGGVTGLAIEGLASAVVLPMYAGVAMVASTFGALARKATGGSLTQQSGLAVNTIKGPQAEVSDEEVGYE